MLLSPLTFYYRRDTLPQSGRNGSRAPPPGSNEVGAEAPGAPTYETVYSLE